jgi:hypothetical protein
MQFHYRFKLHKILMVLDGLSNDNEIALNCNTVKEHIYELFSIFKIYIIFFIFIENPLSRLSK